MSPRQKSTQARGYSSSGSGEDLSAMDSYRQKRERNNVAVKKSREKSRQKNKETAEKMTLLRSENTVLENRIDELSQELVTLKKELLRRVNGSKESKKTSETQSSVIVVAPIKEAPVITEPATNPEFHKAEHKVIFSQDESQDLELTTDKLSFSLPWSLHDDHTYF